MKKVISFGEIMLRLATPGYQRFIQSDSLNVNFGGGEANVAVSLAKFGVPSEFVTRLPENDIADWCISELRKHNAGINYILRGGNRMGIYFLETGAVVRASKVIYDRADSAMANIKPGMVDWKEVFKEAQWFHWSGLTPAISQGAADACLEAIEIANKMGLTVSTDLNYRDKLWKYGKSAREVMPELIAGSDIIVGIMLENIEDEKKIFQSDIASPESLNVNLTAFEKSAQEMMKRFPKAKKIIITMRESLNASHNKWGACMYSDKLYLSKQYDLTHIVDRVGGGDSFFAGLIYGFLTYPDNDQKTLEFATAASSLKHTIYGDFNLVTVAEVEKLLEGDATGRVSR